jgi:predicted phosphoribosyltransferase
VRPLVVAINGGGSVAASLSRNLVAPLEPLFVRELRTPLLPHAVVGALAEGGLALLDDALCDQLPEGELSHLIVEVERELEHCVTKPMPDLRFRTVVLVDDGAMGPLASAVALAALRERGATHVILAAPDTRASMLKDVVDEVIPLDAPASLEGPPASGSSPRT